MIQEQQKTKIRFYLTSALYLAVNGLFVYKYGHRQSFVHPAIPLLLYVVPGGVFFYGIFKGAFPLKLAQTKKSKYLYIIFVSLFVLLFFLIVYFVKGENIQVDRWSALELTVKGIVNGQYPYTRLDHLGNMSSNLPALGWLAIPFYFLGDVGYLQVFVFLLFAFYLFKSYENGFVPFIILILYLLSPAFWWEIVVKSDLVSNMLLFVLMLDVWERKFRGKNSLHRPFLLGAILAFFLLTRGVLVVPMIIFFFKEFWDSEMREKLRFVVSFLLSLLLISLPLLLSVPDWDTLVRYNPFVLQTNKAPLFAYLFLLAAFAVPYRTARKHYFFYAALLVFAIPFSSLFVLVAEEGWRRTIFESLFDMSYLSMSLPFALFAIVRYLSE